MTTANSKQYHAHAEKIQTELLQLPAHHPLRELLATSAALLLEAAEGLCPSTAHDHTRVALIDKDYHWQPINKSTPKGAKMQLINREFGVAVYGTLSSNEKFFTHWAPLPTFKN